MMMDATYWYKQRPEQPLFPELIWSRPENKRHAGKLAIIGGNSFGFASVGQAYQAATQAGIGTARVLLPQAVQKVVGPVLENGEFAPSNPSGSFSQEALSDFLDLAAWADSVLLAGDFGRNSETAILFEKFLSKATAPVVITKDAVDYFSPLVNIFAERQNTVLVLSMAQLQKLAIAIGFDQAFRLGMDLVQLTATLHTFTQKYPLEIVVKHLEVVIVAVEGAVSTTKTTDDKEIWRVETAASCAVWRLQNPIKSFAALTTAIYDTFC